MAKKDKKAVLLAIGVGLALTMSSGAFIRTFTNEKTKVLASYSYNIGAVTSEGNIDKENKSSMTSDKMQVKTLVSIEKAEDAEVIVFVHWYNEDGDLLKTDEVTDETPEAPEGAETFRVEIEPTEDEDGEISIFEKGDYAKMVTVTLKK